MSPEFLKHQQEIEKQLHSVWMPHSGQIDVAFHFFYDWVQGVFMRCGRKFGKALALDTPILTPNGFVAIGDIRSGDVVYDENGNEQTVLIAHDVINEPESFRVHFCDGTHIDACADHQWLTWTKSDRKNFRRGLSYNPSVKSTFEIFQTQMNGKEYNHSIPYASSVSMRDQNLPIDPYILGLWLGDGNTNDARFSTIDDDILDYISQRYEVTKLSGDNCDYYIRGLQVQLRHLGLIGNKHVPQVYQFSSENQRLELLKGLMDSDGTVNKSGNHCCFDNTNENLARSVEFLVASLGMKPIVSTKIPTLNGTEHRKCYRVQFRPYRNVFRLFRKSNRLKYNDRKFRHRTIKKVERIESVPMRCLTVSGKSSLFLAGRNLIPTHNTEFAIYCMYMFCKLFENSEAYYIADEKDHARDICWDNRRLPEFLTSFRRMHGESVEDYQKRKKLGRELHNNWVTKINESEMYVRLDNGSMMKVDGAKNWKKADGLGPIFIVYDEFKNHDPRFDRAARPNLMDLNGRILIIGTPPDNEDNYYCETEQEFINKPNHVALRKPSWMNPHVYGGQDCPKLKIERDALKRKGELHVYLREYECEIVPDLKRQIFPMFEMPRKNFETEIYDSHTAHFRPHQSLIAEFRHHPKDWELFACFDAGSATAFAVLMVAINKYDRRIMVLDEVYMTEQADMTTRRVTDAAIKSMEEIWPHLPDWRIYYDYAAKWFANEVNFHYDPDDDNALILEPSEKDIKKKEAKLSLIKDIMLAPGLFQLSDRCQKFAWELGRYAKDENGRIPKENDHAIDCISGNALISTHRGLIRMDEIAIGDFVETNRGWDEVTDHWVVGERNVVSINGLVCTPDHRIFTINRGFARARSLTDSDTLLSIGSGGFLWKMKLLFIRELSLLGGLTRRDEVIESISRLTRDTRKKESNIFTDIFMNKRLDIFLKGVIFIMLMIIRLIMIPLIWSAYLLKIISAITIMDIVAMPKNVILIALGILPLDGILPKKAKNGIVKIQRKCGKKCQWFLSRVKSAEKSIWSSALSGIEASIAIKTARPEQIEEKELVYDMTTKNHSRFFADGILVHNCFRYILNGAMYDEVPSDRPQERRESDDRRGFTPDEDASTINGMRLDQGIIDEFYE